MAVAHPEMTEAIRDAFVELLEQDPLSIAAVRGFLLDNYVLLDQLLVLPVDKLGGSPLHVAVLRSNTDLLKMLIEFATPYTQKDEEGRMAVDLLEMLTEKRMSDAARKMQNMLEFASLVYECPYGLSVSTPAKRKKTPEQQQKEKEKAIERFRLHRALALIRTAEEATKLTAAEDVMLVFGKTQVGKSSLINYLCGTNYRIVSDSVKMIVGRLERLDQPGSMPEVVLKGDGIDSKTLYPQAISGRVLVGDSHLTVVDTPGFTDVGGTDQRVCAAAGRAILAHRFNGGQKIKATVFAIDYSSLINEPGFTIYRDNVTQLAKLLPTTEARDGLLLVVTRLGKDFKMEDHEAIKSAIRKTLEDASASFRSKTMCDHRQLAAAEITDVILKNFEDNVFLGDITTSVLRTRLLSRVASLQSQERSAFDFRLDPTLPEVTMLAKGIAEKVELYQMKSEAFQKTREHFDETIESFQTHRDEFEQQKANKLSLDQSLKNLTLQEDLDKCIAVGERQRQLKLDLITTAETKLRALKEEDKPDTRKNRMLLQEFKGEEKFEISADLDLADIPEMGLVNPGSEPSKPVEPTANWLPFSRVTEEQKKQYKQELSAWEQKKAEWDFKNKKWQLYQEIKAEKEKLGDETGMPVRWELAKVSYQNKWCIKHGIVKPIIFKSSPNKLKALQRIAWFEAKSLDPRIVIDLGEWSLNSSGQPRDLSEKSFKLKTPEQCQEMWKRGEIHLRVTSTIPSIADRERFIDSLTKPLPWVVRVLGYECESDKCLNAQEETKQTIKLLQEQVTLEEAMIKMRNSEIRKISQDWVKGEKLKSSMNALVSLMSQELEKVERHNQELKAKLLFFDLNEGFYDWLRDLIIRTGVDGGSEDTSRRLKDFGSDRALSSLTKLREMADSAEKSLIVAQDFLKGIPESSMPSGFDSDGVAESTDVSAAGAATTSIELPGRVVDVGTPVYAVSHIEENSASVTRRMRRGRDDGANSALVFGSAAANSEEASAPQRSRFS